MNEKTIISKLRNLSKDKSISLNFTDDAAILDNFIISKDILVENIHFIFNNNIDDIVFKAVTSNISDIAAMGGVGRYIVLGLGLPYYIDETNLINALEGALEYYKLDLIGGDISKSPLLFISITIIGNKNKFLLTRSGAKPGDIVCVSRPLGKSIYYLKKELKGNSVRKHYRIEAEVELGALLGSLPYITSCTDISDGLGIDLFSISDASKVKIIINKDKLPIDENVSVTTEEVLRSGEEYALIFTLDRHHYNSFLSLAKRKIYQIGTIEEGSGVFLKDEKGLLNISNYGYLHNYSK